MTSGAQYLVAHTFVIIGKLPRNPSSEQINEMSKRRVEDLNVDEILDGKFMNVIAKDQHKRARKAPADAPGTRCDLLRVDMLVRLFGTLGVCI